MDSADDIRDLNRWALVLTPDMLVYRGIPVQWRMVGLTPSYELSPVWQRHLRYLEAK